MPLVVQKYGGTSVSDSEKIKKVAQKITQEKKKGNDIVVVVSAMGGETDRLVQLAHNLSENPPVRDMDLLLSSGERISAALLSMAINTLGFQAISLTGRQVGIITDGAHTKARIKEITGENILSALKRGNIVVVAGFQGISDQDGGVTTLGRGGSDTTAVALAAALQADICEIYTDVLGVFTTDPAIVPEARKIEKISFEEMLEMASLGAKVLQTRSVELAKKYSIPILVKSTFVENAGTLVTEEEPEMEKEVVLGITYDKNQAKITFQAIPDQPGIASQIFEMLAEKNHLVDMIIQNVSDHGLTDLSFTIPKKEAPQVFKEMQKTAKDVNAKKISLDDSIAKVSIVGVGMKSHSGVASKMFSTLAKENINIMMISTSEIKISCVIQEKYTELAVRILHKSFELDKCPSEN